MRSLETFLRVVHVRTNRCSILKQRAYLLLGALLLGALALFWYSQSAEEPEWKQCLREPHLYPELICSKRYFPGVDLPRLAAATNKPELCLLRANAWRGYGNCISAVAEEQRDWLLCGRIHRDTSDGFFDSSHLVADCEEKAGAPWAPFRWYVKWKHPYFVIAYQTFLAVGVLLCMLSPQRYGALLVFAGVLAAVQTRFFSLGFYHLLLFSEQILFRLLELKWIFFFDYGSYFFLHQFLMHSACFLSIATLWESRRYILLTCFVLYLSFSPMLWFIMISLSYRT